MAEWLDLRRKVLPRHHVKVHHVDSHDSHEWMRKGTFRREYFGESQTLALFAFCCFMDGAIMNFSGGELGLEKEYIELMRVRRERKALLMDSVCDYLAVKNDNNMLFTLLREKDGEILVPVISFTDADVESVVDLSCLGSKGGKSYELTEIFSGKKATLGAADLQRFIVKLPPCGYQLWDVKVL
jgi:hypothetical protein